MKSIRDNIDILCTEYGVEASYAPQIEREVIDSWERGIAAGDLVPGTTPDKDDIYCVMAHMGLVPDPE